MILYIEVLGVSKEFVLFNFQCYSKRNKPF